jgi:hypothetical protein
MTIEDTERAAYISGDIERAALLARIADLENVPEDLAAHLPVRFFIMNYDLDDGPDLVEVAEDHFRVAEGNILYERHTLFANGVDQICLTKGLDV